MQPDCNPAASFTVHVADVVVPVANVRPDNGQLTMTAEQRSLADAGLTVTTVPFHVSESRVIEPQAIDGGVRSSTVTDPGTEIERGQVLIVVPKSVSPGSSAENHHTVD